MTSSFFVWAEPLLLDDDNLRRYYLADQALSDPDLDNVLGLNWMLYELELKEGLLGGAELSGIRAPRLRVDKLGQITSLRPSVR